MILVFPISSRPRLATALAFVGPAVAIALQVV